MKRPTLIIVLGPPASDTSNLLAKTVSKKLNVPLISKDDVTAMLSGGHGQTGIDSPEKAQQVSSEIIAYIAHEQLRCGNSLIIQAGNIQDPEAATAQLQKWQELYNVHFVQIHQPTDKRSAPLPLGGEIIQTNEANHEANIIAQLQEILTNDELYGFRLLSRQLA